MLLRSGFKRRNMTDSGHRVQGYHQQEEFRDETQLLIEKKQRADPVLFIMVPGGIFK